MPLFILLLWLFSHLFVYSRIRRTFIEHLLSIRHLSKHWRNSITVPRLKEPMKSNVLVSCCNKVAYKCFCSTWFATIHIYSCTMSLQVNSSLAEVGWVAFFQAVIQLCLAPQCFLGSGLLHVYLSWDSGGRGSSSLGYASLNYTTQTHLI